MARASLQRVDVQRLVDTWAREASARAGGACTPMLAEFDFGFVAWVAPPPGALAEPDSSACHVIDRISGKIIPWGSIPPAAVAEAYLRIRPPQGPPPVTADPVASIRRAATVGLGPTIAAHVLLSTDRVLHIAYGAKGDQELNHHPLVHQWLAALPPNQLNRGAPRHAELLAISDALHAHDAATGETTTLDEARRLFSTAVRYEVLRVSPVDGGKPAPSCHTCYRAELHFGLRRTGIPSVLAEQERPQGLRYIGPAAPEDPNPLHRAGRGQPPGALRPALPAEVRAELGDARYTPALAPDDPVRALLLAPPPGDQGPDVPARWAIAERYEHLSYAGAAAGQAYRRDGFVLSPRTVGDLQPAIAPYAARLGASVLYPIGRTSADGVLVGDERGRIFVIDQAGEWFVGNTIDEAAVSLVVGRTLPRLRDDGGWDY